MEYVEVFQEKFHGEEVTEDLTVPSTRKSTLVTAMLSEAEATTLTVPETVEPEVGDVTEVVGEVVSEPGHDNWFTNPPPAWKNSSLIK